MNDQHVVLKENLAAYALGSLDGVEVRALEAHLQTCDSCQTDLKAYRSISAALVSDLPPAAPPAAVRRRLQARVGTSRRPRAGRVKWSLGQLALGGAVAALIGLNLFSVLEVRTLRQEQVEQEGRNTTEQTAIAMLAYPGTQTIGFDQNGVTGSLLVDKQRNLLAVFAWHLPAAPAGKTYQVWLIDARGDRTSGGFLEPESDYPFVSTVIRSPAPLTGFTGFGVTTEPLGGSPAPTGPRVFGASF